MPRFIASMGRLLVLVLLASAGCAASGGDGPEAALSHFLDLMDRSRVDSRVLPEAFSLLDEATQAELAERARRARTLAGRDFQPWQMLAQGRFRLRFAPALGGMQAQVHGDQATVAVRGQEEAQRVEVPMVRQDGSWRVVLSLPPSEQPARLPVDGTLGR